MPRADGCTCPSIDGFRIKRTTCPVHSATDTYPPGTDVVTSRDTYGSTVEGRGVPSPVAPIPARERPSAARSGSSVGDDTSDPRNGPSADQPSLLDRCPGCYSMIHQPSPLECKDEWHDH